jgi:hypothetical protein
MPAESGSELSCDDATGANTMAETVTVDGPTVAKRAATVSASALALHLDCCRTYIGKLEADGVIQRQGDGFPLDQSRVAYLRYLRREHRHSPRSQADADPVKVKTEMPRLRLMEKRHQRVKRDECRCAASVPFNFDVHALFFSKDAVGIETEMHQRLWNERVNLRPRLF